MGLIIPEGCKIRAGDEVRQWEAGRCIVFDDSFEHEVCFRVHLLQFNMIKLNIFYPLVVRGSQSSRLVEFAIRVPQMRVVRAD